MQQRVIEWKLTALVLTGLLVVALAHKCILATMMVKPTSEKRLAPALDIAVGKWFTPGIGLRVAYNGLQAKGGYSLC